MTVNRSLTPHEVERTIPCHADIMGMSTTLVCRFCGADFARKPGARGRPPSYCTAECRERSQSDYFKRHYAANRDKRKEESAAYYRAHREQHRERGQRWREQNRDYENQLRRERRASNVEKTREEGRHYEALRRARQLAATTEYFSVEELYSSWEDRGLVGCTYCDNGRFEHIDHVIPLARGGTHSLNNLVPACAHCNKSKGAKLLEEWLPLRSSTLP